MEYMPRPTEQTLKLKEMYEQISHKHINKKSFKQSRINLEKRRACSMWPTTQFSSFWFVDLILNPVIIFNHPFEDPKLQHCWFSPL